MAAVFYAPSEPTALKFFGSNDSAYPAAYPLPPTGHGRLRPVLGRETVDYALPGSQRHPRW
jgi:hypothetical protein